MSRSRLRAVRVSDTPRSVVACGTPGCLKRDGHRDMHTRDEVNVVGSRVRTPPVRFSEMNNDPADACLSDAESDYELADAESADNDSDAEATFESLNTTAAADLSRRRTARGTKRRTRSRSPVRRTKQGSNRRNPCNDVNSTNYNLEDHVYTGGSIKIVCASNIIDAHAYATANNICHIQILVFSTRSV